jgi:hypothetical protein
MKKRPITQFRSQTMSTSPATVRSATRVDALRRELYAPSDRENEYFDSEAHQIAESLGGHSRDEF